MPHERDGPCLLGIGFDGAIPFVSSTGVRVLSEAILYRVFKKYPAIIRNGSFENAKRLMFCHSILGQLGDVYPMKRWDWIRSMKGRRRRVLIRADKLLEERGELSPLVDLTSPFGKTENLPYFTVKGGNIYGGVVEYVPRLIQAPHDETHLVAGPYLKELTHAVKSVFHHENWLFYASVAPEKLDLWLRSIEHHGSYFWSDYSAFDATWSKQSWDMIETIYRRVLKDTTPEFWRILDIWRTPHGKVRCRKDECTVEYQSDEANASGRDDTAVANALFNAIALAFSVTAALFDVPVENVGEQHLIAASQQVRIAVVGDDSLVAFRGDCRPISDQIQSNLETFGLNVKANSSLNLWDVTFLGCMPYPAGGELFWGPTIGRRMYKAFWKADRVGHLTSWARGVAQQLSMNQHVPFLCEVGERVFQLTCGHPITDLSDQDKPWTGRTLPTRRWDQSTVEWLSRRYPDFSAPMLGRDLKALSGVNRLPCVMHSEVFTVCVMADEL